MGGETAEKESGWTVDTLKAYFDALRRDDQVAVALAMSAAKEATLKAELASEKRFEGINEFRGALNDVVAQNLTRNEYYAAHNALIDKIADLQRRAAVQEGVSLQATSQRQTTQWSTSLVASLVFGVIGSLVGIGTVLYLIVHLVTGK